MAIATRGDGCPLTLFAKTTIISTYIGILYLWSSVLIPFQCNYNSSGVVLYVGGHYNQNQNYGLFYLNGNNSASNSNNNIGSRIH